MSRNVVTARIDDGTLADLDTLAKRHDRSRSWLAARAIKAYVDQEMRFLAFVKEGEDDFVDGKFLTQAQMEAWFEQYCRDQQADAA